MNQLKPTKEFYDLFQFIHEHFNLELFDGALEPVMIVITRKKKSMGHYSPKRWVNQSDKKSDEISVNPLYFTTYPLIEILQTMVHEMCHQWQEHFGKPSGNYHNKEFAEKMIAVGLMPSTTGQPGGKITGQSMSDYPIAEGLFVKAANKFVERKQFKHLWYDRLSTKSSTALNIYEGMGIAADLLNVIDGENAYQEPPVKKPKSKLKYTCLECKSNV